MKMVLQSWDFSTQRSTKKNRQMLPGLKAKIPSQLPLKLYGLMWDYLAHCILKLIQTPCSLSFLFFMANMTSQISRSKT